MVRQRLIDYCDTHPVGVFTLRFMATLLSFISLVAAIATCSRSSTPEPGDAGYGYEYSFNTYWRVPLVFIVTWNFSQLIYLSIRGSQFLRPNILALVELVVFAILLTAFAVFLVQHKEKAGRKYSQVAAEGWPGLFSSLFNFVLSIAACQDSRQRQATQVRRKWPGGSSASGMVRESEFSFPMK